MDSHVSCNSQSNYLPALSAVRAAARSRSLRCASLCAGGGTLLFYEYAQANNGERDKTHRP